MFNDGHLRYKYQLSAIHPLHPYQVNRVNSLCAFSIVKNYKTKVEIFPARITAFIHIIGSGSLLSTHRLNWLLPKVYITPVGVKEKPYLTDWLYWISGVIDDFERLRNAASCLSIAALTWREIPARHHNSCAAFICNFTSHLSIIFLPSFRHSCL